MENSEQGLTIGSAGNTWNPCLLVIRAKGYTLKLSFSKSPQGDYSSQYEAQKGGRFFIANDPTELLGLIALWEVRGDEWQTRPGESYVYDELYPASETFDFEGNLLEIGDHPVGEPPREVV